MGRPLNGDIRAAVNAALHVQVEVERIELPPGGLAVIGYFVWALLESQRAP